MIKPHSDDPDVEAAAKEARVIVHDVLAGLPKAEAFDYGGHEMRLGEYDVCTQCTGPIAEAQQAHEKLLEKAKSIEDDTVREHVELAAELFRLEAAVAQIRAELHNGQDSEAILNDILGFIYGRAIHDDYAHSHHGGK